MSPLNIHPEEAVNAPKKKKNKTLKAMLGVGAIILVPVIGSTFAATIGINAGSNIQFGQGVVQATACDPEVIVTPFSSFVNDSFSSPTASPGGGIFYLGDVEVSTISGCDDKFFTVKAYKDVDQTELAECKAFLDADTGAGVGVACANDPAINFDFDLGEGLLAVNFGTANVLASDVFKFTVESSD